jgi:hypothetical protein
MSTAVETPDVAAKRIRQLIPAKTDRWGVSRCDGTLEELSRYRSGSHEYGWNVTSKPTVGDLLVGCVGQGRDRVIINVNRVEGLTRKGVEWMDDTDVQILPSIGWSEVASRFGRGRVWRRLEGSEAARFIHTLADEVLSMTDVSESEGATRQAQCRERSPKNRLRKLDLAKGVCEGCERNFRIGFGVRGDRALEVHHLKPLSATPGVVRTRLADLAVLCASCHRLVHADPQVRLEGLRAGWNRMRSET